MKRLQSSQQEAQQQMEWWRGQVDELKGQLRGEATRVLELQKKEYNAKMAQEAAAQVMHFGCNIGTPQAISADLTKRCASSVVFHTCKSHCYGFAGKTSRTGQSAADHCSV